MAGCDVVAKYNSADVHIAPAEKSGRVTVFPDCIVREVLVSDENRATGVRYLHRVHQREGEVRGRAVVVACACVQSIALLMMSTSRRYPTGLANSSGQLGRHFIPHFTGGIECVLEDLRGKRADQRRGVSRSRLPAVVHAHDRKRGYARSFGAQLNYQNRRLAGWAKTVGGFGRAYKASVKAAYPAFMQFTPYGEMLPNAQSYVDLDRDRTDKFGLPLARRHLRWGANEEALFNDMVRWSLAILEKAGAEDADRAGRPGAQPRAGRLPDGPRPADARSSTPTAARTTCRISTWWTAACSRRRRRRTRRTRSWRSPRAPPSTSPTGCEGVSCDRDAATRPEDARHDRR